MASAIGTRKAEAPGRVEPVLGPAAAAADREPAGSPPRRRRRFSALTQRILAINLLALGIVVGGFFYLDQYQRGLIEGRLEALATQGLIIAAALGEAAVPHDPALPQQIDASRANDLVQALVQPVRSRARVFQNDGELIVDSRRLSLPLSQVRVRALPPPDRPGLLDPIIDWLYEAMDRMLIGELPHYVDSSYQRAEQHAEVVRALRGGIGAQARLDAKGNIVLNVAVPVRRFKAVLGALMLTAGTEDIAAKVRATRGDVLALGLMALAVTVLLSLYLAATIARPIHQLALGAERVTRGHGGAGELPDLGHRDDEIGDLSEALRTMTRELHNRIDAIDGFAADVAHELKNPLSSLRSAVETLERVDDGEARQKLLRVLVEDVDRMDRLISDISAASRLDAELNRAVMAPIDLAQALEGLVATRNELASDPDSPRLVYEAVASGPVSVRALDDRLAQVFRNLIDNAISFSPPGGTITVRLARRGAGVVVSIEDQGPGFPAAKAETIFDRFYSERPAGEKFGTHSGLGLSISKQIVEAHGGSITATNRAGGGARFEIWLPA